MLVKTFLIVDGSSMLSTSYYGSLPKSVQFAKTLEEKVAHYSDILQTSNGIFTNAMFTMIRSLFKLLREIKPDYFAVAFDMSRNTFRRTELGASFYKANRTETQFPLKSQFVQMEDFLRQIGVTVLCGHNYEADDYIASVVSTFELEPDIHFIVHTKDHDFMQLVSDNVELWRPVSSKRVDELLSKRIISPDSVVFGNTVIYDSALVEAETGVKPTQIVDLLAIAGDSGDGIPGCKGVSSAAAPLLQHCGSLNVLYETLDACLTKNDEKVFLDVLKNQYGVTRSPFNALRKYRDDVFLSQKLAQMKRDIGDIPKVLSQYEFRINTRQLYDLLQRYEMKSLISYCETVMYEFGFS